MRNDPRAPALRKDATSFRSPDRRALRKHYTDARHYHAPNIPHKPDPYVLLAYPILSCKYIGV